MEAADSARPQDPASDKLPVHGSIVMAPLAWHTSYLFPRPQSAPPPLCPSGRTPDLKALLNVVDNARSFIYIAVMNYLPTMEFSHPRRYCGLGGQGATGVGEGVKGPRKQAVEPRQGDRWR